MPKGTHRPSYVYDLFIHIHTGEWIGFQILSDLDWTGLAPIKNRSALPRFPLLLHSVPPIPRRRLQSSPRLGLNPCRSDQVRSGQQSEVEVPRLRPPSLSSLLLLPLPPPRKLNLVMENIRQLNNLFSSPSSPPKISPFYN